jgi:arginine exporter protein ArgO
VLTVLAAHGVTHTSLLAQPGTVAFLVVFGMAVILYFVFRSMSKHLRKVNQMARDEEEAAARAEGQDPTNDHVA